MLVVVIIRERKVISIFIRQIVILAFGEGVTAKIAVMMIVVVSRPARWTLHF